MGDPHHILPASSHLYNSVDSSPHPCSPRAATIHPAPLFEGSPPPTVLWPLPVPSGPQPPFVLCFPLLRLAQINNFDQKAFTRSAHPLVTVPPDSNAVALSIPDPTSKQSKKPDSRWRPSRPQQQPDGHLHEIDFATSVSFPMTPSGQRDAAMTSLKDEDGFVRPQAPNQHSTRPILHPQHSNSVPSTPSQHARDLTFRSRSPSPTGDLGSHSPRSVVSETNGPLPSLRKPRPGCRFETSTAFGRRRIPYTIGTDLLEPAPSGLKRSLNPDEEKKLSGDMWELYDRLLPTAESEERRIQLVEKLERILKGEWPGNEFHVRVFGSSGNLLCTTESDVDICIQTSMRKLESMHLLAEVLSKNGMERVVCVSSAKVPIVKIWDPQLRLACDMNVNNTLALENTRLIKTYIQIDERVRPLAMVVKHWTKQRIVNDAALGGTLSSYTWICMILNFLQTREPPILPALHKMPYRNKVPGTEALSEFADDLSTLRGFGAQNTETIGELLFHFFRRYGHEIDFECSVISVRNGRLLTRKEKGWDMNSLNKEGRHRLCVEEPFSTSRNLGNSADDFAWRGIHLELRQAFRFLANEGNLGKACEQYEFPPEEKTTFKKPTPAPKPILQSAPQATRGGRSSAGARAGRNSQGGKGAHSYRRASSGATFGNPHVPFGQSPPLPPTSADYFGLNQRNLHDQLYQQYQFLEMYKGQLFAQAQAQAAHVQVRSRAQAAVQPPGRSGSLSVSPQKLPFSNGQPHPRGLDNPPATAPLLPGYIYPYHFYGAESMAHTTSQDGTRTNPSSPSLSNVTPSLRRSAHRSSITSGSPPGSTRSHSQPARPVPGGLLPPGYPLPPNFDPASFMMAYPQHFMQEPPPRGGSHPAAPIASTQPMAVPGPDHGVPKEYVGYYLDQSTQAQPQGPEFSLPQIPSYQEITQRRRKMSSELLQPTKSAPLNHASRSPSPLGRLRNYSNGPRSAPMPLGPPPRGEKTEPYPMGRDNGLLIVNGSYPLSAANPDEQSEVERAVRTAAAESGSSAQPAGAGPDSPERGHHLNNSKASGPAAAPRSGPVIVNGSGSQDLLGTLCQDSRASVVPTPHQAIRPQADPLVPDTASPNLLNGELARRPTGDSPKSGSQPLWRPSPVLKNGVEPLELPKSSENSSREDLYSGTTALSPVPETSTPSPTASRTSAWKTPRTNGSASIETTPFKENSVPEGGLSRDATAASNVSNPWENNKLAGPVPPSPGQSGTQSNPWQQSTSKKHARKKSKSKGGSEPKMSGEPMPTNEAERKGG